MVIWIVGQSGPRTSQLSRQWLTQFAIVNVRRHIAVEVQSHSLLLKRNLIPRAEPDFEQGHCAENKHVLCLDSLHYLRRA